MRAMTTAIGYGRISSTGQEDGMGLEAQRRRVREYAAAEGIEIVEFVHETASGAVREGEFTSAEHRAVMRSLLDRAEAGEFDTLIVASFDRLSRDQIDAAMLKRWFAKYGVRCLSAAGETNGTDGAIAELIDRILGAIHEFDRKRILERVGAGKAEKKALGRHVHGRVPYGYRSTAGILEPDAERAEIVRRIFNDSKQGDTPGRIARALNTEAIPSPGGKTWRGQAVAELLRNPAYTGERYGVKRAHPAIVSRQLFNAAQPRS